MVRTYKKKRKFFGNQHLDSKPSKVRRNSTQNCSEANMSHVQDEVSGTPTQSGEDLRKSTQSASARKIGDVPKPTVNTEELNGYRFIDIAVLSTIFQMLPCKECFECQLEFLEDSSKRVGCASCLSLTCKSCGWTQTFFTSEKMGYIFEINQRMVYSMRSIGCGLSAMNRFCSTMNMPPPVGTKPYNSHNKTILRAVKDVAEKTTKHAAQEIFTSKTQNGEEIAKTAVSCDGTWQRRGFSSLHGCVTVISMENGKILDIEPLSKVCNDCRKHENDEDTIEHREWKAEHEAKCKANYSGSSPAMEPEGAKRIFSRSITSYGLQYNEFYGDGDSKSFSAVEHIYEEDYGVVIEKKECVGHVQKRLGTALRKLKKETKGLGGKGKLTDNMIDKLQNYYGIAIRSNSGNLKAMESDVIASLWHCASNDEKPLHMHCPDGKESWCGYKRDKANQTSTYKHGKGLPLEVSLQMKPVYTRLSDKELLRKCLDGKTQNQNEAFNGMIWQRVPKTVYVGSDAFQLGVYDAVAHFNIGNKATIQVLEALGMKPGSFCLAGMIEADRRRVIKANYKSEDRNKKRRKVLRGKRKQQRDKNEQKEGKTYDSGTF